MIKIKLKSVVNKSESTVAFLDALCAQTNEHLVVRDNRNKILYGNPDMVSSESVAIDFDDDVLGFVQGGNNVMRLAKNAIEVWLEKEKENKVIGREVLDLYREVNLIYKFTEQLADRIDPGSIGELALNEVSRIMRMERGAVLLQSGDSNDYVILSEIGESENFFNGESDQNGIAEFLNRENPELFSREDILTRFRSYPDQYGTLIFAPLKVKNRILGIIYLIGNLDQEFRAADLKLLTTIALQTASAIESSLMHEKQILEARQREETMKKIQEMTSRFVPYEFLKSLGYNSLMETQLGDYSENVVTVLFIDIRKFTSLSENMTPEDNFRLVSSFNGKMGPVIKENKGFINQYLGDGMMAIFPHDPTHALKASIEMLRVLHEYNKDRIAKKRRIIRIGIGIHTGPLVMGITGDDKRWDATTISDTVNSASRIESLTKMYKCNIILSKKSCDRIKNIQAFNIRSLGRVQLKGRQEFLNIYECFDGDPIGIKENKIASLTKYDSAIDLYQNKHFNESEAAFTQVLNSNPDDETTQYFLDRISELPQSKKTPVWDEIN